MGSLLDGSIYERTVHWGKKKRGVDVMWHDLFLWKFPGVQLLCQFVRVTVMVVAR